jgi:Icc protein
MPSAYYAQQIKGIWFIVLDGNEKGSPVSKGGYPSYIGTKQVDWLKQKLKEINEPVVIVSHQPLAGEDAVDNAEDIQKVLSSAADKILIAINGHTHVNCILRKKEVTYLHINSASYFCVGDQYIHNNYSPEIVKAYPWLSRTCPYKDALFTMMKINLETLDISFSPSSSEWIGQSPAALDHKGMPSLTIGEEIAPKINSREILKLNNA